MERMHSQLKRQTKRYLDSEPIPRAWEAFMNAVNEAYRQMDLDRRMLERSLDLSSSELLEANAEMRAIFQAIPDILFRLDGSGTILDCKAGAKMDFIAEPKKMIGKRIQEIPMKSIGDRFQTAIDRLQAGKTMVGVEYSLTVHGQEQFYEARLLPFLEDQIIAIIRNITDRKRTEIKLMESEKLYRTFINATYDMVFLKDERLRNIVINQSLASFFGKSEEHVVGKSDFELMPQAAAEKCRETDLAALEKMSLVTSEEIVGDQVYETLKFPVDLGNNRKGVGGFIRNITDRKRAEEERERAEYLYRTLARNAQSAIFIVQEGRLRFVNPYVTVYTGYEEKELIGKDPVSLIHPDDRESAGKNAVRMIKGKLSSPYEFRIVCKNGDIRWIMETNTPFDYEGKPAVLMNSMDITERKRTEEALEKRILALTRPLDDADGIAFEELFNLDDIQRLQDEFARATGVGSLITRTDGTPITSPSNFCRLCGDIIRKTEKGLANCYRNDSVIGRASTYGPTIEPCLSGGLWDAGAGISVGGRHIANWLIGQVRDETQTEENMRRYAREIGADEEAVVEAFREVPVMSRERFQHVAHALFTLANQLSNFAYQNVQQARFITERKQAEEALRESEEQFRAMFELASIGMAQTDLQTGRWLRVNRKMCDITGYSSDEMLAMCVPDITHPEDREKNQNAFQRVLRGEAQDFRMEKRYIRKDGRIAWVNVNMNMIRDPSGQPVRTMATIEDITERKQAEEEHRKLEERLQRAEKMEALGTLAGGVAHDLNNVLGVMVGYSELLMEELPESNPLRKFVDNIYQSSIRGAAIIQDLLTLARRGVSVSEIVDLNRLVFNYLRTPEFEKLKSYNPGVNISTDLQDGLLNIKGSPVHLGKTIMNLVMNAMESISGRGEVTIRTENRYLDHPIQGYDEMREGDYVVLTVSDTGIGISSNDLGKIFEPFYTKKVMGRSGTGLGLAVVWGTVKDHHGYIDVHTEVGKGSVFTLYFPVTREEPEKVEKVVSSVFPMSKGESILVIDDVEGQRELAISMLGRLGYRVEAVAGGEEAVEYLKNKKVDLMILDMIMEPGIDGMETYRRILEINPGQKAIIVSGFSESDRVRKTQEMGAGAFVRKPYILENIGLAIRKELDRK